MNTLSFSGIVIGTSHRVARWLVVLLALVGWPLAEARAQIGKLGVIGDSLSDEYFEETYGSYAVNWPPLLAVNRSLNLGPTAVAAGQFGGTWGEPRRTGYQYCWARTGATSAMIVGVQDVGLAAQVAGAGITHAVLAAGTDDFSPYSTAYYAIYNGTWTAGQIQNYVAQTLTNIEQTLVTVQSAGVDLVLATVLDPGWMPGVQSSVYYANASQRSYVSAVLETLNQQLKNMAQRHQVPLADWYGMAKVAFGTQTNLNSVLEVGNVAIRLDQSDTDPINHPNRTAGFVADGGHPHTVLQGLLANVVLEALNEGYGTGVPLFTEQELLAHAGVAYGGADTLAAQLGAYRNYVMVPWPPAAPRYLCALARSKSQVVLYWTDTSNHESGFAIDREDGIGGPWAALTNVAADVTTFIDSAVHKNVVYSYRIRACSAAGCSPYSNVSSVTPLNSTVVPNGPTNLVAVALSPTKVRLTWADIATNESGFRVHRWDPGLGQWVMIGTTGANVTQYKDTLLAPGTLYSYYIRASNPTGKSAPSNVASITTPSP